MLAVARRRARRPGRQRDADGPGQRRPRRHPRGGPGARGRGRRRHGGAQRRRARRRSRSAPTPPWSSSCPTCSATPAAQRLADHTDGRRAHHRARRRHRLGPVLRRHRAPEHRGARPGPRRRLRRPDVRRPDRRGGLGGRLRAAATASPASSAPWSCGRATTCSSSAPTRRSPTTRSCERTTPPWRCACSARTSAWSGTSRRSTTSRPTRGSASPACCRAGSSPGLGLLVLVMIAVVLWRSRRLGALATEPLPVVVRAVETTRSLGRLYRRAGDRGHAAASLRRSARATVRRAAAARVAHRPRHPGARGRAPYRAAPRPRWPTCSTRAHGDMGPPSDKDLITLAQDLAALDREVRRT